MSFALRLVASRLSVRVAVLAAVVGGVSSAQAVNVLTDSSYELNPLDTIGNVLSNLPVYQGIWGQESATIFTGPDFAVSPASFSRMLKVSSTGGGYSQTGQAVDVSAYAVQIDAGNVVVTGSSLFNADLPAADASVGVSFVNATATWGNFTGADLLTGNVTINANPNDWELVGTSGIVPVGTRWIFLQTAYRDVTLLNSAGAPGYGYVDDSVLDLRVVPEPTTLGVVAGAMTMLTRRRRA